MKKQFYTSVIEKESPLQVLIELDKTKMSKKQKEHLASIFYSSIHVSVIDTVLTELSPEDRETFLEHLHADSYEKIWNLLKEKTLNIEFKIAKAALDVSKEFLKDIEEVKKKK